MPLTQQILTCTVAPRLAILLADFGEGGVERMACQLARALAADGVATDLLTSTPRHPLVSNLPREVGLVPLAETGAASQRADVEHYLESSRPRVVLTGKRGDMRTAQELKRGGYPFCHVLQHATNLSQYLAEIWWPKRIFERQRLVAELGQADLVLGNSREVVADIRRLAALPGKKVLYAPSPIVTQRMLSDAELDPEHPWLAQRDMPVIVASGRLTRVKDYPTLLRAVARMQSRRPARLIVLGSGRKRTRLARLAADLGIGARVDFRGYTPNPYPYYRAADLFAHASRREGFPNVLVEAMAFGTPVVSTDCRSGPREILHDGQLGALVPVGDHQALAQAMVEAVTSPQDPNPLRARALEFTDIASARAYREILGL